MWNPSLIDGPIPIEGSDSYHLNVAPEIMTPALAKYAVEPSTPERQFGGGETDYLTFPSEAAAKKALKAYWIDSIDPSEIG